LFPPVLHTSGLPAALRWLANQTRSKYGISVEVTADPHANPDRKDVRTLLFESVRELLFNAVKHAQADRVVIDVTLDPDDTLCIRVADSGVGFDPAELVERVYTGQVGWGLFSIRERLTLLGGRFEIDSAPGQGTRFHLIAPMSSVAGSTLPRALRILIADDHAEVRRVYRSLFDERSELRVVGEASDGLEAIAQAHALKPDVILMDVSMPNLDGIAATRRIRTELPALEILGLSMQPRTEDVHPIEQAGAAGFFMKGIETPALIERLLAMHRALGVTAGAGRPPARVE
jgi:CheY-like chemotaxis protein/anti-sigma regulatory factor (Ser/Thr protein kinase)